MTRTRLAVLAAFAAFAVPLQAQQKIARRIAIDPDASIRIGGLAANIRLIGWDRDSIVVSGFAAPGTSFFFGGSGRLAKMGLERDEKSPAPSGLGEIEVRIPSRARVWVKTMEGWIEASGLSGEADLVAVVGSIKVNAAARILSAETLEGSIEISGASQLVRVKTGNGKVVLTRAGGDVTVSTVGGPVSLLDAEPATARIETVSGPVVYEGKLDRRAMLDVQTHSGAVELRLPRETGAEFDLHSIDGTIQVALSPKGPFPKLVRGKPVFFGNAGGGANVVVRSFKGDIRIIGRE
jgi:hypothetical protein